ncbi:MAG TPA: cryptochrome/photolyase family protein [Pseudomonadales bacterium]|nr:cryptochrome/photolyase family protein [Pseudomonadales bacterium]
MSRATSPSRRLVLVLGDQLGDRIPALEGLAPEDTRVLFCEVAEETSYAPHHALKIALVLAAMRHAAERLRAAGFGVEYTRLDDPDNGGSFTAELDRALDREAVDEVRVTEAGEWRVQDALERWAAARDVTLTWVADDRFVCSREDFAAWIRGRKSVRMEHFYRQMRRQSGLLMDDGAPVGGKWNFDADNRRPLPAPAKRPPIVAPLRVEPDAETRAVLDLVSRHCPDAFGTADAFAFAVTPEDARRAFAQFLEHGLPHFGDYQDAMAEDEDFIYHSLISIYLNIGLLDPLACCRAAETAWRDGQAPLNAVEGFIRQILGWREFVRGIYWHHMPEYAERNHLGADLPLPEFYWSADTGMNCMRRTIEATRRNAYAHHIQRLMVTGNFALIAGLEPRAVCDWYLGVYADAFEWVELPNTLGMALYGDGGLFASKPYAASGRYIDRMSDYCKGCRYDPKRADGDRACPFNYLYWDFIARQEERLRGNPRMGMMYKTMERMGAARIDAMRELAAQARADLDAL